MKKGLLILIMSVMFFSLLPAEEIVFHSEEEKQAKIQESYERYVADINKHKMDGNLQAYYFLYDYMGSGYIKLSLDFIFEVKNWDSVKSKNFTVEVKGVDETGFTYKDRFKAKKKDFYVNAEGNGVIVLTSTIEKGIYKDMTITLSGDKGETATVTLPEFKTLNLSDLETKITDLFFISSLNEVRNEMFLRRKRLMVPTLIREYKNNKKVGFYFEYYHLAVDALHKEGKYLFGYKLIHDLSNIEIYSTEDEKAGVGENGNQPVFLDLSSATPGVYRFEYTFKDLMGEAEFSGKKYFYIGDTEKKVEGMPEDE